MARSPDSTRIAAQYLASSSRTACIVAAGKFGDSFCLLKNRDRNYLPKLRVVREVIDGVEVAYVKDEKTSWVEGMNEHGIGIVNAALMVSRDESERDEVERTGKKLKDGARILRALREKTVKAAARSIREYRGGLKGHTIISDGEKTLYVEMPDKDAVEYDEVDLGDIFVRTNHGIEFPDAGYVEGPREDSSKNRQSQAEDVLSDVDSVDDVAPSLLRAREDRWEPTEMVRDDKSSRKMRTTSQLVLDLTHKKLILYLIPGRADFLGIDDKLPDGVESKITVDVREYEDLSVGTDGDSKKLAHNIVVAERIDVGDDLVDRLRRDLLAITRIDAGRLTVAGIREFRSGVLRWSEYLDKVGASIRNDLQERTRSGVGDSAWTKSYIEQLSAVWKLSYVLRRVPDLAPIPSAESELATIERLRSHFLSKWPTARAEEELQSFLYRNPFPTAEEKERVAVDGWEKASRKWVASVRVAGRAAWKYLRDLVAWAERGVGGKTPVRVSQPVDEAVNIEGFNVIFRGFAESAYQDDLEGVRAGLRAYRKAASSRCPILLKAKIPIVVEWEFDPVHDQPAAHYTGRQVIVTPWSLGQKPQEWVRMLAHEFTHHLYRNYLSDDIRRAWSTMVRGDYKDLDLREALRVMEQSGVVTVVDEKFAAADPVLYLQINTLMHDISYKSNDLWSTESIRSYLDRGGDPIVRVPTSPISGYSGKNDEEAMCEAVGHLVAYGPNRLPDQVLRWLRTLLGREVRVARTAAAYVKLYHVSTEANIQRFRGRWSPKLKMDGIFATPSKKSIYQSWADWVAGKKFRSDDAARPKKRPWYENLTLYTLAVSNDLYDKIQDVIPGAIRAVAEGGREVSYGAWFWDAEVFIPAEYLDQVKIVGRETLPYREFRKKENAIRFNTPPTYVGSPVQMAWSSVRDFMTDTVLRFRVPLDRSKYVMNQVQAVFFDRTHKLVRRGEGPDEPLTVIEKKILANAVDDAKALILSLVHASDDDISAQQAEKRRQDLDARDQRWRHENYPPVNRRRVTYQASVGRLGSQNPVPTDAAFPTFRIGDFITYGKFQNKPGRLVNLFVDDRGIPMIEIEPVPKGRKKNRVMGLYRIRHAMPAPRVASAWLGRQAAYCAHGDEYQGSSRSAATREASIIAYHGTTGGFDRLDPDKSGLGTHFGTHRSAVQRLQGLQKTRNRGVSEIEVQRYRLDVKRPLITDDIGSWDSPPDVEHVLIQAGVMERKDLLETRKLDGPALWVDLRRRIEDAGYDSIAYKNLLEDRGSLSYIVWDPTRVKRVADAKVPAWLSKRVANEWLRVSSLYPAHIYKGLRAPDNDYDLATWEMPSGIGWQLGWWDYEGRTSGAIFGVYRSPHEDPETKIALDIVAQSDPMVREDKYVWETQSKVNRLAKQIIAAIRVFRAQRPRGASEHQKMRMVPKADDGGTTTSGMIKVMATSLSGLRRKMEQHGDLQDQGIWLVVADLPPTPADATFLGVPRVSSLNSFRDEGGLLYVSDVETARQVNRFRDGLQGKTSVVWVTDAELLATNMPDLFAHRSGLIRVAAKYKKKKKVPKADGDGTTIVYEYSDAHVRKRHEEKAERYEGLSKNIGKLRKQVAKDLDSDDPKTRLTALAVGLIDAVFERVGNDESADKGHFGVTGWLKKHLTFGKGTATIRYVGKSGVDHEKIVNDKKLVEALKGCCDDKKPGDPILSFGTDDDAGLVKISSRDVNEYLEPFDVTAKDIRGFHANREMQENLRAVRKKGGKLPSDKKEKEKKLKEEFKEALDATAEAVGHEAATLRTQYLVPGLEDSYVKDGSVTDNLKDASRVARMWLSARDGDGLVQKITATQTPAEKEDDEIRRLHRPSPKKKPPREDSQRNLIDVDQDPDLDDADKDTSLNYKDVGG